MFKLPYTLVTVLTSISTISFAAFVYSKGRTKKLNVIYALWALSVGLWSFFLVLNIFAQSQNEGVLWVRMLHLWAIIIPAVYVHFVLLYLQKYESRRQLVLILYFLSAIFSVINFTPWLMTAEYKEKFDFFVCKPKILYPFHLAIFMGSIGYVYYELFRSYVDTKATGEKTRIKYFFIATISAYSGGITNYLINYDILIYPFYPYGNLGVLIYVAVMGFAIMKYRFLDIEVIVRKTLVFAGLTSFVFGVFTFVTFVARELLSSYIKVEGVLTNVVSIFVIVLCYDPLRQFLVNITDRFLFQKKYNYRELLKDASKGMALIKSLNYLSKLIVTFISLRARIKNVAAFIATNDGNTLELKAARGYAKLDKNFTISADHLLIKQLNLTRQPIRLTDLSPSEGILSTTMVPMREVMTALKAEVIIPSFLGRETAESVAGRRLTLRSVLVLGGKKSDEEYTDEDLDVFYTLAQEAAIAIENARLYDEAVTRSEELQQINSQLDTASNKLMRSLSEAEVAKKELENTNEKLRVTQASLIVAEKNATMVGMAKAIGHEINNPLSTVGGRATWIYRDNLKMCRDIVKKYSGSINTDDVGKLNKSFSVIDDNARRIEVSAKRVEYVVKTLTDILKDTKGKTSPLSLTVMCQEAMEATRFQTYEENLGGCEIKLDIAAYIMIRGNLEQLLQVMVNLIKNAYEAMGKQKNREITIRGYVDPDNPKMARIEVADNGRGIPHEILSKVWMQGFSTKAKTGDGIGAPGQGQGLFICKHMIESVHGGKIEVESMVGKGTTFIIKLPIADEESEK